MLMIISPLPRLWIMRAPPWQRKPIPNRISWTMPVN